MNDVKKRGRRNVDGKHRVNILFDPKTSEILEKKARMLRTSMADFVVMAILNWEPPNLAGGEP